MTPDDNGLDNHNSVNPFKFRPGNLEDDDWDDNWLSNAMAFFSVLLLSDVCKNPKGLAVWVTNKMWTSCSCCLLMRGAALGVIGWWVLSALWQLMWSFVL